MNSERRCARDVAQTYSFLAKRFYIMTLRSNRIVRCLTSLFAKTRRFLLRISQKLKSGSFSLHEAALNPLPQSWTPYSGPFASPTSDYLLFAEKRDWQTLSPLNTETFSPSSATTPL